MGRGAGAGGQRHGAAEEGIATRAIGDGLDLPIDAVAPEQAAEHVGRIAPS